MIRTRRFLLPLLTAAFLAAADNPTTTPAWKTKRVEQWDTEDAKQFLSESPWAGRVPLQLLPDRSPFERRDSGDWEAGAGKGVGLDALDIILGGERGKLAIERARNKPSPGLVDVRWESALPVRTAEEKLGQNPTARYTDWYVITVYDVQLPTSHWGADKLKKLAYLRRAGKKDFKPSRAEVVRNDDGTATVSYLFSRSEEITRRDKTVIFAAQLDRLFVVQFFYPGQMLMRDELEL